MNGPFSEKNIVLGVTGSIAAYKACEIASRLVEAGANVIPVLTESATNFIGPATLDAITGNHVIEGMFDPLPARDIEHISVARAADLFLIAPATANIIAKAAQGIADDWLSTALLATQAPTLFAPAMNMHMYAHPATQENITTLKNRAQDNPNGPGRAYFIGPGEGNLACGDVGPGRLIDTPAILEAANIVMAQPKDFEGKRVLITSGPNHEPIDPVRYLANRSSGKMGHALALEALRRGAQVTVVTGPAQIQPPHAAHAIPVLTAAEMYSAVDSQFADHDIFIAAAAVADYKPAQSATQKIKRAGEALQLQLEPNPDIVAAMAGQKRPTQLVIGFAAETDDLIENATQKLQNKNLDLIIANPVGGPQSTIGADAATAQLLLPGKAPEPLPQLPKSQLAQHIFDAIADLLPE